jgi:flagellar M-ring protein FliF
MERITALVRSAVGFDEERGDKVEVVNIRFAKPMEGAGTSSPSPFEIGMPEILRIAEIVSLALVALILALFVARPLIKGLVNPPSGSAGVFGAPGLPGLPGVPGGAGAPALAGVPTAGALPGPDGIDSIDEQISVARIQGDMSAATLRQVAEVVDNSPERTVAIIRGWMSERR